MESAAPGDITQLLLNWGQGSTEALDELLPRMQGKLRFFGGLDVKETAAALEISPATVKRDWATARAFLFEALQER